MSLTSKPPVDGSALSLFLGMTPAVHVGTPAPVRPQAWAYGTPYLPSWAILERGLRRLPRGVRAR